MTIHNSADIHPSAQLGSDISVGPFAVIGPDVKIGDGTWIGPHVHIEARTEIGRNCRLFQGAAIGGEPQILGFKDVPSSVRIGDGTTVREYATIHRSAQENGATTIGSECMLMNYVHIAHDCELGDRVIVVNYTGLSGHVVVEEKAFVSGQVGVHQFVRIGKHAMVGGASAVSKDILPFSLVEGAPARLVSTNAVGLRRSDFKPDVRAALKKALKFILQPELNTAQAIGKIKDEIEMLDEIRYLIDFIKNSSRGITK